MRGSITGRLYLPLVPMLLAACVATPADPVPQISSSPAAAASAVDPAVAAARIAPSLHAAAEALMNGVAPAQYAQGTVRADAQGRLQVYVHVDMVTPALVATLEQAGLQQAEPVAAMGVVQGWVAADRLTALAAVPGVAAIVPPRYATTR